MFQIISGTMRHSTRALCQAVPSAAHKVAPINTENIVICKIKATNIAAGYCYIPCSSAKLCIKRGLLWQTC